MTQISQVVSPTHAHRLVNIINDMGCGPSSCSHRQIGLRHDLSSVVPMPSELNSADISESLGAGSCRGLVDPSQSLEEIALVTFQSRFVM